MAQVGRQQMQGQRAALALIAPGRDVPRRLVDHRVGEGLLDADALALEAHLVFGGVDLGAQLSDDLAVDLDEAGRYQALGSPATGDPRLLQHFLQP